MVFTQQMITVNIRTSLGLNEIFGQWRFNVRLPEKSTFNDLMNDLTRVYGKMVKDSLFEKDQNLPASHIMFMVNGRNINFLNKKETVLEDGDQVTILLPAGGG